MARRSRRQKQETMEKSAHPLRTAVYCRLSVEDREMDTIQAQVRLVQEFIRERSDLALEETYVDNGVTGTKFDRPEWNRLMDDVRSGRIECIVVKDLSRFGRDYLETGYYLENIFPKLHVRFLAVTDNFDSARQEDMEDIAVPVKNMVNAMYAKDISRKIHAARDGAMERGERLKNSPPLGYMYADGKKEELVIDEETAPIVRMIFHWASVGAGVTEIAKRLTFLQVPSPRQWQRNRSGGQGMEPALRWSGSSLTKLLGNRVYCGDTVTGMVRVKMHKQKAMDEADWHVTEDTHEPIISRELFCMVQDVMRDSREKLRRKKNESEAFRRENDSPLRGLVRCGICGHACSLERGESGLGVFRCTYHYSYKCENRRRIPVSMPDQKLRMVVMDGISGMVSVLAEQEKLMREGRRDSPFAQKNRELRSLQAQRDKARERGDGLYEDYADGSIDAEEYLLLKENYRAEEEKLNGQIAEKEKEIRMMERKLANVRDFLDTAGRREEPLAFDGELVKALVENVEIFEDGRVVVHFRFDEELKELMGETRGEDAENG